MENRDNIADVMICKLNSLSIFYIDEITDQIMEI